MGFSVERVNFSYPHFVKDSQIKTQMLGKDQIKVCLREVGPQ